MISWSGWKRATVRKFFVAAILSLQMSMAQNTILAQDAKTGSTSPAKPQARSLAELVDAAKAESPIIRNAQLGLESVVQKQSTLDKMRFLSLISRELPVRKKQSQAGLNAASANLAQAEHDLKYAVSYAYISIIYANQQLDVADRGINDLATLGDIAKEIVKTGSRNDVSKKQIDQIAIFLNMFQGKREEGTQGVPRAKAALREALGIEDSSWDLTTADKLLSLPKVEVNKDSIIKLALERRGEIQQAEAGVDAACLEIQAQQYIRSLSGRTFAAGGDIHANILPGASLNEDYKPGALAPEMPASLFGSKKARVEQAGILHEKAQTVAEKAKALVALEAETTYLKWIENKNKAALFLKAAEDAEKLASSLKDRFDPRGGKVTLDEVITTGIQSKSMKILDNEAIYKAHIALIGLERVTAGGFLAPPITGK
ncbi:MAG: hypothetical protein RL595_827 [Planctomycetota bacterium]